MTNAFHQGKYKDCPCDAPSNEVFHMQSQTMWNNMIYFRKMFKNGGNHCGKDSSKVPVDYFRKIYPKFCADLKKSLSENPIFNSYSNDKVKPQKRSYPIAKRAESFNSQDYDSLTFGFSFSGGSCKQSCEDAFEAMTSGGGCEFLTQQTLLTLQLTVNRRR